MKVYILIQVNFNSKWLVFLLISLRGKQIYLLYYFDLISIFYNIFIFINMYVYLTIKIQKVLPNIQKKGTLNN